MFIIPLSFKGFDDAKLGESMYLPLAERMLEKITDDQNFRLNNGSYFFKPKIDLI